MFALAACTPTIQHAHRIPLQFDGPRFDVAAHRFYSFDGAPLGLSAWTPADEQEPWAVIIGLHGMNDYGEANFYLAGPWFAERGVAVYAYDARGQGRSPDRGVWGGERLMTEDLRTAVSVARRAHPNAVIAVVGESMGAATAMVTFGSDNPPQADRVVLVSPAVWGWSTMPDAYALTLWTSAHMFPWQPVQPPRGVARHIAPSDNIEMLRHIGRDPNMLFTTRIDALYGLVNLMEHAAQAAPRMTGDVAYLYGAHDQVVPRASAVAAARRLPATARTGLYPDGYHLMLRDLHREVVYADILSFIRDPKAPFPSGAPPLTERRVAQAANR
ncbi:MAG TPA: alpha/beta fold hydrolase [Caulobacterales bacterium]|nr:alpha/beta fold hydrolase [Caulobacterales bacterium]